MPRWAGSDRRSRLPPDWASRRLATFRRDGWRCRFEFRPGQRCPVRDLTETGTGLECDHIRPGDDHSPGNLRTLCKRHHLMKSGSEGAAGRRAAHDRAASLFRRDEAHPGLLR